jgi:hypothetical protein
MNTTVHDKKLVLPSESKELAVTFRGFSQSNHAPGFITQQAFSPRRAK